MRANMQYNKTLIEKAVKFLNNKNVEVEHWGADDVQHSESFAICVDVHNNRIWTDGDDLWSTVKKGVKVRYANFLVHKEIDDSEALGYYWSGGLAGNINYDGSGKDGTWYDGGDVETQLINKIKDKESDGMIYGNGAFINNLQTYMIESCDFDKELLQYLDFDYSEQGMQDDEAVNLDVDLDADFWLEAVNYAKEQGIEIQFRTDVKKAA